MECTCGIERPNNRNFNRILGGRKITQVGNSSELYISFSIAHCGCMLAINVNHKFASFPLPSLAQTKLVCTKLYHDVDVDLGSIKIV